MGRVDEVLCAAASGDRVYLAARDKSSQLYLIRSTTNPASFADAKWELYTEEPHKGMPTTLGPGDVSCAAGDDGSFVIMGLRRYSEADQSSTFWGVTFNYNFEVTRHSQWKDAVSSTRCSTGDSCNHMVLAARSRLDYHSKFVHVVYRDSATVVEISPFVEDGFRTYTSPIPVTPPFKELALFSYYEGALASLRLNTNEATNTMSINIQAFGIDLKGIPQPNSAPIVNITTPMEQYCFTDNKYVGKLGGSSGDKMYYWCQSYTGNYGIYEFNGSNLTRIANVQRNGGSYGADSYLPAPAVKQPVTSPTPYASPTWGLVLREGKIFSIGQGTAADSGVWQNSGNALSIEVEGFGKSGLSHVAVAFIAVGSVLALALIAGLGFFWWYRRRRARRLLMQENVMLEGGPMDDPFDIDQYFYTPPWISATSLPPPYAPPPEEHPLSEAEQQQQQQQQQQSDIPLEQSSPVSEENLMRENPSEPPPSVETADANSSQDTLTEIPLPAAADSAQGVPSCERPNDDSPPSHEPQPQTALDEVPPPIDTTDDESPQDLPSVPPSSEGGVQDRSSQELVQETLPSEQKPGGSLDESPETKSP
ncbi:hypothetical protein DFQ26_004130 [Actinomortierella ambigua]|nr:hypothetical protein DFQ26_004130 [Actinomortierella ambigua]